MIVWILPKMNAGGKPQKTAQGWIIFSSVCCYFLEKLDVRSEILLKCRMIWPSTI